MPSHTKDEKLAINITTAPIKFNNNITDNDVMEKLSTSFRSHTSLSDSNKSKLRSTHNQHIPLLRKRPSGSGFNYYHRSSSSQEELGSSNSNSTSNRRRDSGGINYSNCVNALTDYQQLDPDEQSLFTIKREDSTSGSSSPVQQQSLQSPSSPSRTVNSNKGRINKRHSATLNNTILNPLVNSSNSNSNPHGSGGGVLLKAIKEAKAIEPFELVALLDQTSPLSLEPLMIDMRPLDLYEKSHIRHSINVNLPSLLIKRYKRGVVSNFNLESFITTQEGTEYYKKWLNGFGINDIQNLSEGAAAARLVVYDDHMIKEDTTTSVWTLIGVIVKNLKSPSQVNYLLDGFHAFEQCDLALKHLVGSADYLARSDTPPLPIPTNSTSSSSSSSSSNRKASTNKLFDHNYTMKLSVPMPMISRSATTLSSKQQNNLAHLNTAETGVQRRASLFSLDTSMRSNGNSNNSHHRLNTSVDQRQQIRNENTIIQPIASNSTESNSSIISPDIFHTPMETLPPQSAYPALSSSSIPPPTLPSTSSSTQALQYSHRLVTTPKTENEFDFVISEIIPNFLYLGPEIATVDQLDGLKSRSIKRILNMAEECDDDVPGLKQSFVYQKISARDTVEMQNVQGTLKKAVKVIDDSKKHHEPIYVHCKAGKSRSAAAILAYLVLSEHWTLKKAYRHIVIARPNISPNIGFVAELMKLEEGVHGQVSNFAGTDWQLVGTIPPSPDTQKEMGRLEKAWKRGSTASLGSASQRNSLYFSSNEDDTTAT